MDCIVMNKYFYNYYFSSLISNIYINSKLNNIKHIIIMKFLYLIYNIINIIYKNDYNCRVLKFSNIK